MLFKSPPAITLGRSTQGLIKRAQRVSTGDITAHMHVIGVSGVGKSYFLAHLYDELAHAGFGVTLIDPHGDLADLVASRTKGVIYLDLPRRLGRSEYLSFNVLDTSGDAYTTANNIVEAFHRAYPELDAGAPAFDGVIRNAVKLLMSNDMTLSDLQDVLTDRGLRQSLYEQENDEKVVAYFRGLDALPERDRRLEMASALRRANEIVFSPVLRHSLGSPTLGLRTRHVMDASEKVVINLALPDSRARLLLGSLLTVLYEQGALSRDGVRHPHFLIIDEFSEFASKSEEAMSRILSQCRKFGLFLILVHQTWSQTSRRLQGALQNVGYEIAFRLGRQDAQDEALLMGRVNPEEVKHIVDEGEERSHPVFFSLPEQWERHTQELVDLPKRHALVREPGGTVTEMRTIDVIPASDRKREIEPVTSEYFNAVEGAPASDTGHRTEGRTRVVRGQKL